MELRALYKEKDIKNVNATLLGKRETSLKRILEDECLDSSEWKILVNWEIGIDEEKAEDVLVRLEEIFCEEDEKFTKDDEKEMHILAENLIYRYSRETENKVFPLMILCGYHMGYQIKSEKMYREFEALLNGWRLSVRAIEDTDEKITLPNVQKMITAVAKEQKDAENEGTEWEASADDWDELLKALVDCREAINSLAKKCDKFEQKIDVQREESDILWWTINEWSEIYQQSFRTLSKEQLALAVPLELRKMIPYYLGPFAVSQVIYKAMSLGHGEDSSVMLPELLGASGEKVLEQMDFDGWNFSRVQPVMMALWCKKEYGEENWKDIFIKKCGLDPDKISKRAEEFAHQFYLELELAEMPTE